MAGGTSWLGRIARAVLWLVLIWVVLSVGSVLLYRWVNPPFSAFMAESQIAAWIHRDSAYESRHSWEDLQHISPNLPLEIGRAHV